MPGLERVPSLGPREQLASLLVLWAGFLLGCWSSDGLSCSLIGLDTRLLRDWRASPGVDRGYSQRYQPPEDGNSNPRPCVCSQTLWAHAYSVRDPLSSLKDRGWRSKVIAQRALQNFNILKQEASARKHSIV